MSEVGITEEMVSGPAFLRVATNHFQDFNHQETQQARIKVNGDLWSEEVEHASTCNNDANEHVGCVLICELLCEMPRLWLLHRFPFVIEVLFVPL